MSAPGRISALATNTFREAIRNRVLHGVLGAVVVVNLFAIVLGSLSLNEEARVARDVALSGVSLFGALTAIALGVSLLHAEVQKKTIHVMLSKPLHRWEFVVGKYGGMALTLSILVLAFGVALALVLLLGDVGFDDRLVRALLLSWMEVLIVAAVAIFFSSFATPFLSGMFTLALFVFGRWSPEIRAAADKAPGALLRGIADVALYVIPDLSIFAVSGSEVTGQHVSVHTTFVGWGYLATTGLYAAAVVGVLLVLAVLIFQRRDFV